MCSSDLLYASENSRLVAVDRQQGDKVTKGDAICWLEKAEIPAEPIKPAAKAKAADKKPAAAKKSAWKDSSNVIKAEKK